MPGKFEIKRAKDGQFYFHLKAGNGEVILASEMYKAKPSAHNGIESVKKNSVVDGRYERKTSAKGQPYFVLKAGNHEVIGQSQMYHSESARDEGIRSVKRNAPGAPVDDLSAASKTASA